VIFATSTAWRSSFNPCGNRPMGPRELAQQAIEDAIDSGVRKENRAIFELARATQGLPDYMQMQAFGELIELLPQSACDQGSCIGDMEDQYAMALKRVRVRKGESNWESACRRAEEIARHKEFRPGNTRTNRLIALCWELSQRREGGIFILPLSKIQKFLACTKDTAHVKMQVIKEEGFITLVKMGSNYTKQASLYKFTKVDPRIVKDNNGYLG
jgi:hypothetical protein